MEITKVKKRNGSVVDFDRIRIERAIEKACVATNVAVSSEFYSLVTDDVTAVTPSPETTLGLRTASGSTSRSRAARLTAAAMGSSAVASAPAAKESSRCFLIGKPVVIGEDPQQQRLLLGAHH